MKSYRRNLSPAPYQKQTTVVRDLPMIPPEIQRIVLLIALAATGYLLILAWNQDREASETAPQYTSAPSVGPDPVQVDRPQASVESAVMQSNAISSDIPSAQELVTDATAPASSASSQTTPQDPLRANTSANLNRLIKVETSTLRVWIDLSGGDIVRVQLPSYPINQTNPDIAYQLLDQNVSQVYVAQSGLIGKNGPDSQGQRPIYRVAKNTVNREAGGELVLNYDMDGSTIEKIFSFTANEFLIDVSYLVMNRSQAPFSAGMFAQIKRDKSIPLVDESFPMAPTPYLGAATTNTDDRYLKLEFDDIDDSPYEKRETGGWIAFLQHYFLSAWVAPAGQESRFFARRSRDGNYLFGLTGPEQTIPAGATGAWQMQFYAGPKDQTRLESIAPNLNLTVNYGILWWISVPLFKGLKILFDWVGNWGLAIILLTVLVKASFAWISAKGYRSMANMRRVAPAMKALQKRHANDREKLSKEMMALYKKEGANPLGGCLPMLIPMPIFLALYWVLLESVELRQAPFIWWITDLSAMDPYFVLPLLMGASTYLMQALNPQVGDPLQVKIMKLMPIFFTAIFLFFPAGLVLYWLVNNLLSIAQQTYMYRLVEREQGKK